MSLKLPIRELRRRPTRFLVATVVLAFLSTLLLFLGGLLDGLYLGSTGAVRAQNGDVIVYSSTARDSFLRSRITADVRSQVEAVRGVEAVGAPRPSRAPAHDRSRSGGPAGRVRNGADRCPR